MSKLYCSSQHSYIYFHRTYNINPLKLYWKMRADKFTRYITKNNKIILRVTNIEFFSNIIKQIYHCNKISNIVTININQIQLFGKNLKFSKYQVFLFN